MKPIQNAVATRALNRTHPDGTVSRIEITIGDLTLIPSDSPDSSAYWEARIEIDGGGLYANTRIYGEDSMQALYLAMAFAGLELSNSDFAREIEDFSLPNFGFPTLHTPAEE